jgi:hypothetical protein
MAVTLHVSAGCLGEGGEGPSSTAARTELNIFIICIVLFGRIWTPSIESTMYFI